MIVNLLLFFSDYISNNSTINVNNPHYPGAKAGDGVVTATWQLLLAMLFKAIITIFTFGIKVLWTLFKLVVLLMSDK